MFSGKTTLFFFFCTIFMTLVACQPKEKQRKSKKKDGLVRQYRADGSLKTAVMFENGKKNGLAKSYYKDGTLRQQITYVNNVKHGDVTTYYENEKPYQVTPYVNGKIEGIRKKYRMDGRLAAEVPYHNNEACKGLKEYLLNGDVKKKYPEIVFQEIDNLHKSGEFILRIRTSENSKNVTYYMGQLDQNGCISSEAVRVATQKPGVLDLKYKIPSQMILMEEVDVIAVIETVLGNPYLTQKRYNLEIENGG